MSRCGTILYEVAALDDTPTVLRRTATAHGWGDSAVRERRSDAAQLRAMLSRLEAAEPRDDGAIASIRQLLAAVIAKERESAAAGSSRATRD